MYGSRIESRVECSVVDRSIDRTVSYMYAHLGEGAPRNDRPYPAALESCSGTGALHTCRGIEREREIVCVRERKSEEEQVRISIGASQHHRYHPP